MLLAVLLTAKRGKNISRFSSQAICLRMLGRVTKQWLVLLYCCMLYILVGECCALLGEWMLAVVSSTSMMNNCFTHGVQIILLVCSHLRKIRTHV